MVAQRHRPRSARLLLRLQLLQQPLLSVLPHSLAARLLQLPLHAAAWCPPLPPLAVLCQTGQGSCLV